MSLYRASSHPPPPPPHRHCHPHPHLLPSFLRKFPRMSTSCLLSPPSKLPKEILDFEDALLRDLDSLKPSGDEDRVLCLEWLARGLDLALAKHQDAVLLIPPLQCASSVCDEKWMNDYFDQTTRILEACNFLSAEISDIEQGHLLIRYAVHTLGDPKMGLNEDKASRAWKSLRQWIDTVQSSKQDSPENLRTRKYSALLQEMCNGLVVPKDRDATKGFLFALYGANATAVFIFAVLTLAVSRDEEILSISLPLPSDISWTSPIFDMLESTKKEARLCISAGSTLWLRDLHVLNTSVTGLYNILDSMILEKEFTLTEDQADKLIGDIEALGQLVDVLAARLDSVGRKQNEIFRAVVASRSALLDQLGNFCVVNGV